MLSSIRSQWLRKLLALNHIADLREAFRRESSKPFATVPWRLLVIAFVLAIAPPLSHAFSQNNQFLGFPSIVTGACMILAILVRNYARVPFKRAQHWKRSLRLTHTAFGLGCIPVALLLICNPASVADIPHQTHFDTQPALVETIQFILHVALWAALTEEFIYRGLLVSFLRRIPISITQSQKDIFAVIASALLFGIAHIPTWGLALSLAVSGLGIGFAVAFIAIGESIVPLIVYHAAFDILSLTVGLFR